MTTLTPLATGIAISAICDAQVIGDEAVVRAVLRRGLEAEAGLEPLDDIAGRQGAVTPVFFGVISQCPDPAALVVAI